MPIFRFIVTDCHGRTDGQNCIFINKLLPAKVNQIATRLPGHRNSNGPACSQRAAGPTPCLCY